jgi:hypothetical protein
MNLGHWFRRDPTINVKLFLWDVVVVDLTARKGLAAEWYPKVVSIL